MASRIDDLEKRVGDARASLSFSAANPSKYAEVEPIQVNAPKIIRDLEASLQRIRKSGANSPELRARCNEIEVQVLLLGELARKDSTSCQQSSDEW